MDRSLLSATGIIRGSAVTALLQWLGRSNVLFGVLGSISEVGVCRRRCKIWVDVLD